LTITAALDALRGNAPLRVAIGVTLFLAAMTAWSWARAVQGVHFAQIARVPNALVTSGPYRYLRHPLYAATAAGTAGHVVAAGTWRVAVLWMLLLVVLAVRSVREERLLRAAFGPTWDAYARGSLGWLRPSRGSAPK
jgi:protein-S-isoprenylcysteine O-methyltransferase Ste14